MTKDDMPQSPQLVGALAIGGTHVTSAVVNSTPHTQRRTNFSTASYRPSPISTLRRRASSSPRGAVQQSTLGGTAGDQRQPRLGEPTVSVCTRCGTDLPRTCSWRGCHCISSRSGLHRRRASPSSGSEQQWVGENVCRGYTNGYTAAKRPPRILSETASDLLFSVGMTGFEPAAP